MDQVKVKKTELLKILNENLEKHVKNYNEAVSEYKGKAIQALQKKIEEMSTGENLSLRFSLPTPVSHEKDYKNAIGMLEMSVDAEIKIQEHEYEQFILDEWHWKKDFEHTTMSYLKK